MFRHRQAKEILTGGNHARTSVTAPPRHGRDRQPVVSVPGSRGRTPSLPPMTVPTTSLLTLLSLLTKHKISSKFFSALERKTQKSDGQIRK